MKRAGFLFDRILEPDNFREAFLTAARGKQDRAAVIEFRRALDENLQRICREVAEERFVFGLFNRFTIQDPKLRVICAAPFSERVIHHAVMNVCGPFFDRTLISDTFACRSGKGRTAAVQRAVQFTHRFPWVLKLDIRRYFDSVDQTILINALEQRFKDPRLLRLFRLILASYATEPGRGLPIGNLTSQYFANHYLDPLDRWIKEDLRRPGYVRYMDDFLVFGESAGELKNLAEQIGCFVQTKLGLRLKDSRSLHAVGHGVAFLGYRLQRVTKSDEATNQPPRVQVLLSRRSKLRFHRRLTSLYSASAKKTISDQDFQRRSLALCEFTRCARAANLRRHAVAKLEIDVNGPKPRGPRRQLEQCSGELPLRQPQRESPGQPEQQPGLPSRSGPSSPLGSESPKGGTDVDSSGQE